MTSLTVSDLFLKLHICHDTSRPHHDSVKVHQHFALQKLAASLDAKGLSPETGISASDEDEYGTSIATFLQYGSALSVIDQIGTHAYQGVVPPAATSAQNHCLLPCQCLKCISACIQIAGNALLNADSKVPW